MPVLDKEIISQFLRTECRRQVKLGLYPDKVRFESIRKQLAMPPRQPQRPGFRRASDMGAEWETKQVNDLHTHLGASALHGGRSRDAQGRVVFGDTPLDDPCMLPSAQPHSFLVQPSFVAASDTVTTFAREMGLADLEDLEIASMRPDLIEVLPERTFRERVTANGDCQPMRASDTRLQLRVIDIKLTSEPGASHFAEVVYYTLALAGWLEDSLHPNTGKPYAHDFVVVPNAAVWPGSHDLSALVQLVTKRAAEGNPLTLGEKLDVIHSELEQAEFEVFLFRLRRLFRDELPEIMATDWRNLPLHVTTACRHCDYLGYPWQRNDGKPTNDPSHCFPTAERLGDLSRLPFMSRGQRRSLESGGLLSVSMLADRNQDDPLFDTHPRLQTARTVLPYRAGCLVQSRSGLAPNSGGAAALPNHVSLRIFITAAFEVSTAVSLAFGVEAQWRSATPWGWQGDWRALPQNQWRDMPQIVDQNDVKVERRVFLQFLHRIQDILSWDGFVEQNREPTRVQVYIWDQLTFDHLCRVVGRHLDAILADRRIRNLAWLFPAEPMLQNSTMASRSGAITILDSVVKSAVAVPVPHHYSLLQVARHYQRPRPADEDGVAPDAYKLSVHPLYEETLSSQIPSERAHDVWARGPEWQQALNRVVETVRAHLLGMRLVQERVVADMRAALPNAKLAAPALADLGPSRPLRGKWNLDTHLWLSFAKLDNAISQLEKDTVRAMPVHEREARGKSVVLPRRLVGPEEQAILVRHRLRPRPGRRVYTLSDKSRDVSAKDGDIGWALSPGGDATFLDVSFYNVAVDAGLEVQNQGRWRMSQALSVTLTKLDREAGVVVVDAAQVRPTILDELEAAGICDLAENLVLDPVHIDALTGKLQKVVERIGLPQSARANMLAVRATGYEPPQLEAGQRYTGELPLNDLLWNARALQARHERPLPPGFIERQKGAGTRLNDSQWSALERCLAKRVRLLWGPPGTGKTHTLVFTIAAAVDLAVLEHRPLRILITAHTWTAIDNLLAPLHAELSRRMGDRVDIARLCSASNPAELPADYPDILVPLDYDDPSAEVRHLRAKLTAPKPADLVVVGATSHQVHNLMRAATKSGRAVEKLFDLVVIDEGSQLDMSNAIVTLAALADEATVLCAGDPRQLPPVLKAEPPLNLEHMVGSIYEFLKFTHEIEESQLQVNYRSNAAIVDFCRQAGYGIALAAHSPSLRLRLAQPSTEVTSTPADWPAQLAWTPDWWRLLAPVHPLTCLVHPDGLSSQWNQFETQVVAALSWLLNRHKLSGLDGELDYDERPKVPGTDLCTPDDFWRTRLGIVTPHRAQRGRIIQSLSSVFSGSGHPLDEMRAAVDTVERFQGQQRDVLLASFALGDPDAISEEASFLYSLRRFNVMASRARAKLIVIVSQEVIDHLSDDVEVLRDSRLLKVYAEAACSQKRAVRLPWIEGGQTRWRDGLLGVCG